MLLVVFLPAAAGAADLQPRTVAAFDRYVRATEARLDGAGAFLWIDSLPPAQRQARLDEVRRAGLVVERLTTRENGREIDIPDGLVHHWVGTTFVPGASIDEVVRLLTDYDAQARIYAPRVARSKLIDRRGSSWRR